MRNLGGLDCAKRNCLVEDTVRSSGVSAEVVTESDIDVSSESALIGAVLMPLDVLVDKMARNRLRSE